MKTCCVVSKLTDSSGHGTRVAREGNLEEADRVAATGPREGVASERSSNDIASGLAEVSQGQSSPR